MASLLHDAEQQGILDVHLALVTFTDQVAVCLEDGKEKLNEDHSGETMVGHWRRLDGSDPDIQEDNVDLWNADRILQVTITAVEESLGVSPEPCATV